MINNAAIFTGQGAQTPGMGKDLYENHSEIRAVFNLGSSITGMDITGICFEAPAEELSKTINAQTAIFTLSAAIYELLKSKGYAPKATAGFSLGEIAAHYAAGVFSLEDGFKIIKMRASLMQQAADTNDGAMYAIIGLDNQSTQKICEETDGYAIAVNYNCPGQLVIAGDAAACLAASEACLAAGAKKAAKLMVNGAFHSRHMDAASNEFEAFLQTISFHDPIIPLYTNTTGALVSGDFRKNLANQMNHPVRWETAVLNMISAGIGGFTEIGAGRTLSGLIRRIDRAVETLAISNEQAFCSFN